MDRKLNENGWMNKTKMVRNKKKEKEKNELRISNKEKHAIKTNLKESSILT